MSNDSNDKVEIFQRINKLKLKVGIPLGEEEAGYVDPMAIKKAQAVIDKKENEYAKEIKAYLTVLYSTWEDLKNEKGNKGKLYLDKLYNYANNMKDLAETYKYSLMQHFALSLRNFCEKVDITNAAHCTIVQAHIDAMALTVHENMKEDDSPKAKELKEVVARAIKQHIP